MALMKVTMKVVMRVGLNAKMSESSFLGMMESLMVKL